MGEEAGGFKGGAQVFAHFMNERKRSSGGLNVEQLVHGLRTKRRAKNTKRELSITASSDSTMRDKETYAITFAGDSL
jgi:hypothetical protein